MEPVAELRDKLLVKEAQRDKAREQYERLRHECVSIQSVINIFSQQEIKESDETS